MMEGKKTHASVDTCYSRSGMCMAPSTMWETGALWQSLSSTKHEAVWLTFCMHAVSTIECLPGQAFAASGTFGHNLESLILHAGK